MPGHEAPSCALGACPALLLPSWLLLEVCSLFLPFVSPTISQTFDFRPLALPNPQADTHDQESKIELLLPSDTNRSTRPTTCAGICTCALTANRQATLVPDAAITLDLDEALDVHAHLTPQVAFNDMLFVYRLTDAVHLFRSEEHTSELQ